MLIVAALVAAALVAAGVVTALLGPLLRDGGAPSDNATAAIPASAVVPAVDLSATAPPPAVPAVDPPAVASAPTTGTLRIDVAAPDTLVVDGSEVDRAAAAAGVELPAGSHLVEVRRLGREPWSVRTTVTGGSVTCLEPRAADAPDGTLVVNSLPWSRVAVDGQDVGNTPVEDHDLRPGAHRVVLVTRDGLLFGPGEGHLDGVEPEAGEAVSLPHCAVERPLAVIGVADDRVGEVLEVPADLMESPRPGSGLDDRHFPRLGLCRRQSLDLGHCGYAGPVATSRDRVIHHDVLGRLAPNQGEIPLVDPTLVEEGAKSSRPVGVESQEDDPARAAVEAMGGVDFFGPQEVADEIDEHHIVLAPAAMDQQPGGLVHGEEPVVAEEHAGPGDVHHRCQTSMMRTSWPRPSHVTGSGALPSRK